MPLKTSAETIASHLESKCWVNSFGLEPRQQSDPIGEPLVCSEAPFNLQNLVRVFSAAKLGKRPGPDNMVIDLYSWLDCSNCLTF